MLQKELMQRSGQLKDLIYKAKGYDTFRGFYNRLGIDVIYMERLFRGEVTNLPHPEILKKIANASEGKVTYEQLTKICGYTLRDLIGQNSNNFLRGQLYYADLGQGYGSEQGGIRPIIILQNDIGNKYSPTVICAIVTSQLKNLNQPTHIVLGMENGLSKVSMVELEQIKTVDKKRIKEYISTVNDEDMRKIDKAIKISMGIYTEEDRLMETIKNVETSEVSFFKQSFNDLLYKFRNRQLTVA